MSATIQPGQWVRWLPDTHGADEHCGRWHQLVEIGPNPTEYPDQVLLVFGDGERAPSHIKYLPIVNDHDGHRLWEVSDTRPDDIPPHPRTRICTPWCDNDEATR